VFAFTNAAHEWLIIQPHITVVVAIAVDCCILRVLFCLLFFHPQIFWRPQTDFHETLPQNVVRSEIDYVLWGVHVHPFKKFEGQKNNFYRVVEPKSTLWAPPFWMKAALWSVSSFLAAYCRKWKIGKSKTTGQFVAMLGRPYQTWWGPTTHGWDRLFPWDMGWGR